MKNEITELMVSGLMMLGMSYKEAIEMILNLEVA